MIVVCAVFVCGCNASAQEMPGRKAASPPGRATLGLEKGFLDFNTPDFKLKLVRASQTIAALAPKGAKGFDFTPADILKNRADDGYFHLGDINLRIRTGNTSGSAPLTAGDWKSISTATARKPVKAMAVSGEVLAAADLSPTLPADCPLKITRSWLLDNGRLVLRFELKNQTSEPVQIGSLGMPLIFNNYITGRSLPQAHEICSFTDPYIGLDGGYVQVTRLNGHGPALVVVADGRTPFEAYNPLLNDPTERNQTFEGFYEWMVHSEAYAKNEWKNAQPWNTPTTETIAPGKSRTYGLKFLVADQIRDIEKTLEANDRPVAVGIPGYVLPMDIDGRLFLKYTQKILSIKVEPENAIAVSESGTTKGGWMICNLQGKTWGRARLTISYADGLKQSINYCVIKPEAEAVADLGNFLMTKQWFTDPCDYFHRSPSVMSYDREVNKIVMQDNRAWIAGLGDEGGSGPYVTAAMKEFGQPDKDELVKFEQFVNKTLWGGIQYSEGPLKYGVRKSMFYYAPKELPAGFYRRDLDWSTWTSWNKHDSEKIDRAYNYPHVVAAYWAMYRLARNNQNLVTSHPWDWYLDQAYQTIKFMAGKDSTGKYNVGYIDTGLMEGTIFVKVLDDLKSEGWKERAADVEAKMKERADNWKKDKYPFGSEMAWDSTGQEEVYAWCKYFGYNDKAEVVIRAILGYMPTVPHWGYNGNARRYWDFLYGGKLSRYERQIHHYGSGMNAIPVLAEYREHPDDFYLLRVGYGGTMGALTNIDKDGFASAAFHAWPSTLKWDAYSGDYGPNFLGYTINTAVYIIKHPEFGWQAFGGNVSIDGDIVKVKVLDSMRRRVYIAPFGLWLHLGTGQFEQVEINTANKTVRLALAAATQYTPKTFLRIEQPAKIEGIGTFKPTGKLETERGAFVVPLKAETTWIELSQ